MKKDKKKNIHIPLGCNEDNIVRLPLVRNNSISFIEGNNKEKENIEKIRKSTNKHKNLKLIPVDSKLFRISYKNYEHNYTNTSIDNKNIKNKNLYISNSDKNINSIKNVNMMEHINLTKEENNTINKNINEVDLLLTKEKCIYCLYPIKFAIRLSCNHKICQNCLRELCDIFKFCKGEIYPKCLKCNTLISQKFLSPNDFLYTPNHTDNSIEHCSKCKAQNSKYECLNCDLLFCNNCSMDHFDNNKTHKGREYNILKNNTKHNEEYEHIIKKYSLNIEEEITKGNNIIKQISDAIGKLDSYIKILSEEKEFFIQKTKKNIDYIIKLILTQQTIIQNQINDFFTNKIDTIEKNKNILTIIKKRYNNYFSLNDIMNKNSPNENIQIQSNQKLLSQNLTWLNFVISQNLHSKEYNSIIINSSYKEHSTFLNPPAKKISSIISKHTFLPLRIDNLSNLQILFKDSFIITPKMINEDLLLVLPKIQSGKLLYRITEDGPSPEIFHKKCDLQGPTIILIKTDTHIFGGFNSREYENISKYQESSQNFLFSISDGKIRKPMRCNIVPQLKQYAIRQSEREYSPGFGLNNKADLFISFKKLDNSYSKLNNVYKCPKGYNPKTFLAGKENGWNILEVEIYAIEFISDEEFYLLCI